MQNYFYFISAVGYIVYIFCSYNSYYLVVTGEGGGGNENISLYKYCIDSKYYNNYYTYNSMIII